jgi:hypothetical protein
LNPLFDETQANPKAHPLFPELMAELDALKTGIVVGLDGLIFRRDHKHRRSMKPVTATAPNLAVGKVGI